MSLGGGGSSAPTETRVTQTDLPEYVQPYFERLLNEVKQIAYKGINLMVVND
jgi:hypothetical protein